VSVVLVRWLVLEELSVAGAGFRQVVLVPQLMQSMSAPVLSSKRSLSPPLARPLPIEPSVMARTVPGKLACSALKPAVVPAMMTWPPGPSVTVGMVSVALLSVIVQPVSVMVEALTLRSSNHSLAVSVPPVGVSPSTSLMRMVVEAASACRVTTGATRVGSKTARREAMMANDRS
jgi:hypothetical protein